MRVGSLWEIEMKLPKLTAVIEKEGKWYVANCPELGLASQGRSLEEAEAMIQEAVELFLEEADEAEIKRRLNLGVIARGTLKSIIAQSEIPKAKFMS